MKGEVVVTTNEAGECVAVTRQDEEGQILEVFWEKPIKERRTLWNSDPNNRTKLPEVPLELAERLAESLAKLLDERIQGEKCDCCDRRYKTVYRVPNWVWRVICPDPDNLGPYSEHQFGGLLCMDCAFDRAKTKNIHLYFDASVGDWNENLPG